MERDFFFCTIRSPLSEQQAQTKTAYRRATDAIVRSGRVSQDEKRKQAERELQARFMQDVKKVLQKFKITLE